MPSRTCQLRVNLEKVNPLDLAVVKCSFDGCYSMNGGSMNDQSTRTF